jgi:hypothetical protein
MKESSMDQLIHCVNCDSVFLRTPYDQEPEYAQPPVLSRYSPHVIERDDLKDFMKDHDGHRLEELTIVEDSFISDRAYAEPVKVSYFRATNGKENFVIRKFREKIGETLKCELVAGDYFLTCLSLDVQAREIERQLARDFKENPFPKDKIDAFTRLFDHIVKTVDVKNLERTPEESPHPLEVFYRMDDVTLMYLLRNCHHIFKGEEYSQIEKFIFGHKDDGVLLLRATYRIEIAEKRQEKKNLISGDIPFEREIAKEVV